MKGRRDLATLILAKHYGAKIHGCWYKLGMDARWSIKELHSAP
jgi:hypothetical protein